MLPIVITFMPSVLGRVVFEAEVLTADRLTLDTVTFKLDTGSDFTTLSCKALASLGYTDEILSTCSIYGTATTGGGNVLLQYIDNVSIKFGDREIQGCRVFFALGTKLSSLFGSDILKHFTYTVDNELCEFRMSATKRVVTTQAGDPQIQIYSLDQ